MRPMVGHVKAVCMAVIEPVRQSALTRTPPVTTLEAALAGSDPKDSTMRRVGPCPWGGLGLAWPEMDMHNHTNLYTAGFA